MKNKIKKICALLITSALISCSTSSNDPQPNNTTQQINTETLIVGRWRRTMTIFILSNSQYPYDCNTQQCTTYEFKSNGTCLFTEGGTLRTYKYKIEADFLQKYSPSTNLQVDSDRIASIDNTTMILNIDENKPNVTAQNKRQWVFTKYQ